MGSIKEFIKLPPSSDYYSNFLRPSSSLAIDKTRVSLSILCGDERNNLKTPTDGDSSLVLRYKDKEGAVLSMETKTDDLTLIQLQGAKSRVSYQVATGILWVKLFGDQVEKIATHPKSDFERISMPSLEQIVGLCDSGTDAAITRYKQLANILGLRYSNEYLKFVKTIQRP